MADIIQKLSAILEEKFDQEGYQEFFVVEIQQSGNDHIEVFLDHDTGLQLEHCVEISRFLEKYIEENNLLSEKYTLDVSSAGVGSALKLLRQYRKNIGRLLSAELTDTHVNAKGTLVEVQEDYIVLEHSEKVQEEGKKKKKEIIVRENIPYNRIKKAVIKIAF
jgi:ribosome maturation factor RimP